MLHPHVASSDLPRSTSPAAKLSDPPLVHRVLQPAHSAEDEAFATAMHTARTLPVSEDPATRKKLLIEVTFPSIHLPTYLPAFGR